MLQTPNVYLNSSIDFLITEDFEAKLFDISSMGPAADPNERRNPDKLILLLLMKRISWVQDIPKKEDISWTFLKKLIINGPQKHTLSGKLQLSLKNAFDEKIGTPTEKFDLSTVEVPQEEINMFNPPKRPEKPHPHPLSEMKKEKSKGLIGGKSSKTLTEKISRS